MSNVRPPIPDDISKAVSKNLLTLLEIKMRLPPLRALAAELVRVGVGRPIRNDIVLKLANDSFDLLVIHLASLREGMSNREHGILTRLRQAPASLRRFQHEDFTPEVLGVGGADEHVRDRIADHVRQQMAAGLNRAFDRLFPDGAPVTEEHVKSLITRFRKDTEPTDRDRNRVRAHRYEGGVDLSYRQDLDQVQQQVEVFDSYLSDLYLVLTRSQHHMKIETQANVDTSAADLADLILMGSINSATLEFGVVDAIPVRTPPQFYWARRQQYYERKVDAAEPAKATNL